MEGRISRGGSMAVPIIPVVSLTVIASIVPEIMADTLSGGVPGWLPFVKVILLLGSGLLLSGKKREHLLRYAVILAVIVGVQAVTAYVGGTETWRSVFDRNAFGGQFGGDILLKVVGILPVVLLLLHFHGTWEKAWLGRGCLSARVERIGWLGIAEGRFTWGRLSLISGFLIALGTILLTALTATGFSPEGSLDLLISYMPLVLVLALVNSLCEGVVYRSAILASLSGILPKYPLILTAALLFGVGHYYGIPSGPLGVLMSTALGWYLLRSMYETKGFLASWLIHFLQDLVIFSTVILMRGA